jgi:hypothetical protein
MSNRLAAMMRGGGGLVALGVLAALLVASAPGAGGAWRQAVADPVRFSTVDVFVDAGDEALAAYQVEIRAEGGTSKLVGVEGGEHPAFAEPPYYDPRALHEAQLNERVVIAGIGSGELPTGRVRVARLHVSVVGDAKYTVTLQAAGNERGERVPASTLVVESRP